MNEAHMPLYLPLVFPAGMSRQDLLQTVLYKIAIILLVKTHPNLCVPVSHSQDFLSSHG